MSELELAAQRIVGAKTPRAVMRQVLHGIGPRGLRVEPFAAFLVRVLKIAQTVYAAARTGGALHEAAWARVQDRLWSAYPTGRRGPSGGIARGAYLPSLVQAASGHARKRARRSEDERRTRAHVNALLARFVSGEGHALWPWTDGAGAPLPEPGLAPETAAVCFFVLLTRIAGERRTRGGPSGGLSEPFVSAGFAGGEWLPDRTDDLAVRLLAAPGAPADGSVLDAFTTLVRATVDRRADGVAVELRRAGIELPKREAEPMLARARERLPGLLRWLEENGRELLETT
jgi:hypothetical protein